MSETVNVMPDGYRYYMRYFLNTPGHHSHAFVLASVDNDGYCTLDIADCTRTISLSIDCGAIYSVDDHLNTLHKLALLEKAIAGIKKEVKKQLTIAKKSEGE